MNIPVIERPDESRGSRTLLWQDWGLTVVEDEERKRPRKLFMSPHKEGAVYTILQIQHDDPDNDPRAWDWGLVDFSGVT